MKNIVGIRRENVDTTERRAPLTPSHVRELVQKHGLTVLVEPSPTRTFRDEEYAEAGARLTGDGSEANVIFGVKEVPLGNIKPHRAYCYFSHTIKAQRYNMPMLSKIIEQRATLLDYELVTNESGRRIIFFGDYAGYAGMLNTLWALGRRLEWEGTANPFANLRRAFEYGSVAEVDAAVTAVGEQIRAEGLPESISPLLCLFTGHGHVSRAAQRLYRKLPAVEIRHDDIEDLAATGSSRAVYFAELRRAQLYRPIDRSRTFDLEEFETSPETYCSRLEDFAPHASMIVNGIYWTPRYPRLLTKEFAKRLWTAGRPRLRVIGDITCDIGGSVEFTLKATKSDNPVYVFDPEGGGVHDGVAGEGPVVMAVDKLPTELPRESSASFGDALMAFVPELARIDFSGPATELSLPAPFARALIAHDGQLSANFRYLNSYLLQSD